MEPKDKNYDPDVTCQSDDSEHELNNVRDASCSVGSPFESHEIFNWDGFTLNKLHAGRAGGPQADNDPTTAKNKSGAAGRTQKIGTCISCETANVPLWHGNRYRCHKGDKMKEHASFCQDCATGYDDEEDPIQCPKHSENPLPKSEADQIPLEPVMV